MLEQAAHLMASNPKAFAFIGFESVSELAATSIFNIYKEMENRILTVLKDQTSRGNIPINWGAMFGRVGTTSGQANSTQKSGKGA